MVKKSPKDYKVLVIEDHAEMRSSVRSMINRYGCDNVAIVRNGEEAIKQLNAEQYDLILSDYELGRGVDGQQILEEARKENLVKNSAVYIMITAAQTMDMVMGAIEYHPDGYLAKPITYDTLCARINKIIKFKAHFFSIHSAMDANNSEKAINECDRLIVSEPKLLMPTLRIKGKLLFDSDDVQRAHDLYSQVLFNRKSPWAVLGLCKCLYEKNQFDDAIRMLNEIINENPYYIECYDLLAKMYVKSKDPVAAQQILEQAVAYSPKIADRQSMLCEVATENEDWDVVTQAGRKAIANSKFTRFKNPKNYLNLVQGLQNFLKNGSLRDKSQAVIEANNCIETLKANFSEPDIVARTEIAETKIEISLGNKEKAHQLVSKYFENFKTLSHALKESLVDDIKEIFTGVSDEEIAEELVEEILNHTEENPSNRSFQNVMEENINNRGVRLYQAGEMQAALALFEESSRRENAGETVLVNALQTLVKIFESHSEMEGNFLKKCEYYIDKLQETPEESSNFKRYTALCNQFNQLKAEFEEQKKEKPKGLFNRS